MRTRTSHIRLDQKRNGNPHTIVLMWIPIPSPVQSEMARNQERAIELEPQIESPEGRIGCLFGITLVLLDSEH